jgi:DNA-binding protein HU-beta
LIFPPNHILFPPRISRTHLGGQCIMAGKATKSTPAAKTSRPVTLKHLAATLAGEHQLTKRAGEALLGDLVGLITKHLKKGERIRIAGLGILQVRKRAARMGRNPATGEAIKIKPSKKVAFRAAKELKLAV